ncbi:MAG: DUF4097 family beta strand repeat-containing protein [Bacteroidota bacterium]
MKTSIYNISLLCWLLAIGMPLATASSPSELRKEFKKTINKEFNITADGKVKLHNKFGDLDVHTWDKNQVKINVTITVNARGEDDANKIFERIKVNFSNGDDYVSAETVIGSIKSSWSWWGSSNSSDFAIDYDVYMPKSGRLDLSIHHGNASLASLNGSADIEVRHSEFQGGDIAGDLIFDVAHGDAELGNVGIVDAEVAHGDMKIKNAKKVDVEVRHSDLRVRNAAKVNCNSAHSDLTLGEIDDLRLDSKHDDLEIRRATAMDMESKYSDVEVDLVEGLLKCDMQFGELQVNRLGKNFKEVRLDGTHTDFDINIESGATFKLDAAGSHADVDYPSGLKVRYEKDKSSSYELRGHMGSESADAIIHVRMQHGGLDLDN